MREKERIYSKDLESSFIVIKMILSIGQWPLKLLSNSLKVSRENCVVCVDIKSTCIKFSIAFEILSNQNFIGNMTIMDGFLFFF